MSEVVDYGKVKGELGLPLPEGRFKGGGGDRASLVATRIEKEKERENSAPSPVHDELSRIDVTVHHCDRPRSYRFFIYKAGEERGQLPVRHRPRPEVRIFSGRAGARGA